jgi:hypothetical protein
MKCKQGQMAFIIKSLRKENIGRVVTCEKYLGYYSKDDKIVMNGEVWLAPDTDDYWSVTGNIETQYGPSAQAYIMDSWLRPIDADTIDEDVTEEDLETV